MLKRLRESKDIIEKPQGDGISSFSFSRNVFYSGNWSELSEFARGLFIDTDSNSIVARSYPKFFNFNEGGRNTLDWLKTSITYPH